MTTEFSVKRITDALAAVDKARQKVDSAKATYKASRELLAEAQASLEDAIRAETSPVPLFDQPPVSEVSFTAEVGKALREGLAGTGVVLHENVSVSPGGIEADQADADAWDEMSREQTDANARDGRVVLDANNHAMVEVMAGHVLDVLWNEATGDTEATAVVRRGSSDWKEWMHPDAEDPSPRKSMIADAISRALEIPIEVIGVSWSPRGIPSFGLKRVRQTSAPWDGAASQPDAWRNQGVGLALRTLTVPTTKKLGQAGLATVGQLKDWFLANPGKSIDGLGSKGTLAVEEALTKYLDSRPVPSQEVHPDGDEDAE